MDALLVYLYTLELPDLDADHSGMTAIAAFRFGDQFGLPALRDVGRDKIVNAISRTHWRHPNASNQEKEDFVDLIDLAWTWAIEGVEDIKNAILRHLVHSADILIEREDFQALLDEHRDFRIALVKILAKKAIYNGRINERVLEGSVACKLQNTLGSFNRSRLLE